MVSRIRKIFADRVKDRMQDLCISPSKLSRVTGLNKDRVRCYLRGRKRFRAQEMQLICKALGLSLLSIFDKKSYPFNIKILFELTGGLIIRLALAAYRSTPRK